MAGGPKVRCWGSHLFVSRCRFCKRPYVIWPTPVRVLHHCLCLELVKANPHAAGLSDDPLLPSHRMALCGLEVHFAHFLQCILHTSSGLAPIS